MPTPSPTPSPTGTTYPTTMPTPSPSPSPYTSPPTPSPSPSPTNMPTSMPTPSPSPSPYTSPPTPSPSPSPTSMPTVMPTPSPTPSPVTNYPTSTTTARPTTYPTTMPTPSPTMTPTQTYICLIVNSTEVNYFEGTYVITGKRHHDHWHWVQTSYTGTPDKEIYWEMFGTFKGYWIIVGTGEYYAVYQATDADKDTPPPGTAIWTIYSPGSQSGGIDREITLDETDQRADHDADPGTDQHADHRSDPVALAEPDHDDLPDDHADPVAIAKPVHVSTHSIAVAEPDPNADCDADPVAIAVADHDDLPDDHANAEPDPHAYTVVPMHRHQLDRDLALHWNLHHPTVDTKQPLPLAREGHHWQGDLLGSPEPLQRILGYHRLWRQPRC